MNGELTAEQLDCVRTWAAQGVDLNGIQKKLNTECGVHMTYMDLRFLLLDHGIELRSAPEPAKAAPAPTPAPEPAMPAPGGVRVTLDDITPPGAIYSGKVSFPGGKQATWMVDTMGRLAMDNYAGGKPTPEEMQEFQMQLMNLLRG